MAICTNCGSQIEDNSGFCGNCGAKQTPSQPATPAPVEPVYSAPVTPVEPVYSAPVTPASEPVYSAPETPVSEPVHYTPETPIAAPTVRALPKWLIPAIAIAAAIGVALFLFFGTNLFKSDEALIRDRIEDLEDAYNDGDLEGVMDCMDSTSRAAMELMLEGASAQSGMDIAQMFSMVGGLDDFCTITINSIEINGDTATVSVTMAISLYGMNQSQTEDMPMVKEDGDWYIGGISGDGSDALGIFG